MIQTVHSEVNDIYAIFSVGTALKDQINPVMENILAKTVMADWNKRMAYDICEAALTKFIYTYGKIIFDKANSNNESVLDLLAKIECLMPTEYVSIEEEIELQYSLTPTSIASIAYLASGLQASDFVCEPSAGSGLLGVFPNALGNFVFVNEFPAFRSSCLNTIYGDIYNQDAKYLSDLEISMREDIVIMSHHLLVMEQVRVLR